MYSTIVVGTDGSESAGLAVSAAADLARLHGSAMHVVAAFQPPSAGVAVPVAGVSAGDVGAANTLLAEWADQILSGVASSLDGLPVEQHAVRGDPADAIVSVAEQVGADLIVVGSKGMHRRILGSVPNSVAHKAPCAVLIVKTT